MRTLILPLTLFSLACSFSAVTMAAEHEVGQKDKQFTKKSISVKVGDKVNFVNNDEIFHNVFSLSDAKLFDLGSYPKGDSRSVTFDQKGVVEVECAIHPDMKMTVNVE
ncbi:MAG: plastocyanin/azurin family copper-binding protein [Cellvibrionaceae bacterium]|nr:plastocyanin/azurin family copper-binding protein [Cellvibrionaceae bacterium]